MADLHQDIRVIILHLARAIMGNFLEGIALLRHKYNKPSENSSELTYQILKGALPTRK